MGLRQSWIKGFPWKTLRENERGSGISGKMLLENPFSHLNPESSGQDKRVSGCTHIPCRMIHCGNHSDGGCDRLDTNTREQNIALGGSYSLPHLVDCPDAYPKEQN